MALLKYRDYDKYVLKYLYDIKEAVHKKRINILNLVIELIGH